MNELSVLPWIIFTLYCSHDQYHGVAIVITLTCILDKKLKELFKMMMLKMFMPVSNYYCFQYSFNFVLTEV